MKEINPEEWILVFFYAGGKLNFKIIGTLMLVKQFFVFVKEINKELDSVFNFIPYYYGPYSFVLINKIDYLTTNKLIEKKNIGGKVEYKLTTNGIEKSKQLWKYMDSSIAKKIINLRKDGTQLGYSGILRYIYSRYPEYTTASKIKEKINNEF